MKDFIVYIKPQIRNKEFLKNIKDINKTLLETGKKFSIGLNETAKKFNSEMEKGNKNLENSKTKQNKNLLTNLASSAFLIKSGIDASIGIFRKVIEPFDKLNNKINDNLKKADTITTDAGSYGTSSAKFLLTNLAFQRKGIDDETLKMMLMSFRSKLGDAKIDVKEGKQNFLSNYVNENDTVEGMLKAIREIQKIGDKTERDKILENIFNTRQVKVMTELMETDIEKLINDTRKEVFGNLNESEINKGLDKLSSLEELQSIYNTTRYFNDLKNAWENIDKGKISSQNKVLQNRDDNIYKNMKNYEVLANLVEKLDNFSEFPNRATDLLKLSIDNINNVKVGIENFKNDITKTIKEHYKNTTNALNSLINISNPINLAKRKLNEVKNIKN